MAMATETSLGYLHPAYVESLPHLGEPVRLNACGGWVLRRPIPDTDLYDCVGPYPLFMCRDWARLAEDLASLRQAGTVSAVIVPEPFREYSSSLLESVFDVVRPVKRRWIVDLTGDFEGLVSAHHQRCARRALQSIEIERCADPLRYADEWSRCYTLFAARRRMSGAAMFSTRNLIDQLAVPGLVMYRAIAEGHTIGFLLYMVHGAYAYGHLTGYTGQARRSGVAYAFYWAIFRDLQTLGVEQVDLGGGLEEDDRLARWKAGWTPNTRPSFVCGAILRPEVYERLVCGLGTASPSFFPAYRAPR